MKYYSHVSTAMQLIKSFPGGKPFQLFAKDFFRQNKKYGSKDRKNILKLCYSFFRLSNAFSSLNEEDRMVQAYELLEENSELHSIIKEIEKHSPNFSFQQIFPFQAALSEGIDVKAFAYSHLLQPDLFIRIRPGHESEVKRKLEEALVEYDQVSDSSLRLPAGIDIKPLFKVNDEVVVQDLSSQRTSLYFPEKSSLPASPAVWDCCAASGGKAMLAYDSRKPVNLTVSDIRDSIILNLRARFKEANIVNYDSYITDLTRPIATRKKYDWIIADLPCTGSGTWGRAPENLLHFKESEIKRYSDLQLKILINVAASVVRGGYISYFTCSVFSLENEEVIRSFLMTSPFEIVQSGVIAGYEERADTMYGCLLKRTGK